MKRNTAYLVLGVGVLFVSTSAIFVKLAAAPSGVTAFYRLFFTLLLLSPLVFCSRERRSELFHLPARVVGASLASGCFLAVHYILWFESLHYTSVSSSTVLVTLQPLFTILFSWLFLKERQNGIALTGCAVALVGSFIIGFGDFKAGPEAVAGDLMAIAAAALISAYFFIGQQVRREVSASVYSVLGYFGSVVFLAVYVLIKGEAFTGYPAATWGSLLGLAVFPTALGQFTFNMLLKWLPATAISMSILGEPIGTSILAYFILKETITLQQTVGMVVILAGITLYFRAEQLALRLKGRRPEQTA